MESKSEILVQHSLTGQHYGYSAADLGDLGATEYTLVTIAVDESGSVSNYKDEIEKCIQAVANACKFSPRSDYLLIRLVSFHTSMKEIHGFKQLIDIDPNDYIDSIHPGGGTALFEAAKNAIDATNDYGKQLADSDFEANAIVFIITDGMDNSSGSIDSAAVGKSLRKIMKDEALESVLSILIGVGVGDYADVSDYLDEFKDQAGLNQYVEIKDANDKSLAKLAQFISKSVSSQSSSLGTGGPSQTLTF
jgi:uncharacterized protein YegL